MMECTYVHVESNLIHIRLIQNMHLSMTVTSNCCININVVGLLLIIKHTYIFVF